jgi:hypothetical protein
VLNLGAVDDAVFDDGQEWNTTLAVNESAAVTSGQNSVEWTYEDPDATLETGSDDRLRVYALPDRAIVGETNVAPGTVLTARVRPQTETGDGAVARTLRTRVRPDRTFRFTGNFSGDPPGRTFTVAVSRGGSVLGEQTDGVVRPRPTASLSFGEARPDGTREVVVDTASLSEGGFVVVRESSPDGPVLGTSGKLPPGTSEDVRVDVEAELSEGTTLVAVAHLDGDGNNLFDPDRDSPYFADSFGDTNPDPTADHCQ